MPELPEVENLVNSLKKNIKGESIISVLINYSPIVLGDIDYILGEKISDVSRRGKYILIELGEKMICIHLRMTGQLTLGGIIDKHTHIIFELTGNKKLNYRDVRKFGRIIVGDKSKIREDVEKKLGPEPFDIGIEDFKKRLKHKSKIKKILLDQKIIAGIGNIYGDEILFKAGVSPKKLGIDLNETEIKEIYKAMLEILSNSITKGGSTIKDYVDGDGKKGSYQDYHQVYGKEGRSCPKCGCKLEACKIGGRNTTFCRKCQKVQ